MFDLYDDVDISACYQFRCWQIMRITDQQVMLVNIYWLKMLLNCMMDLLLKRDAAVDSFVKRSQMSLINHFTHHLVVISYNRSHAWLMQSNLVNHTLTSVYRRSLYR